MERLKTFGKIKPSIKKGLVEIYVTADSNDADYVNELSTITIEEFIYLLENYERLKKGEEPILNDDYYFHEFDGTRVRNGETFDIVFNEFVPYGEEMVDYQVHSVEYDFTIYDEDGNIHKFEPNWN